MPTNIHVSGVSEFHRRAAASWEADGVRFHVWFDRDTKELDRDRVIYKNAMVDHKQPGYFKTRYLKADLPKNAETIKYVFSEIEQRNLIAAAVAEEEAKERAKLAKYEEDVRIQRAKEAGPELLAMLEELAQMAHDDAAMFKDDSLAKPFYIVQEQKIRAVIAKAKGKA